MATKSLTKGPSRWRCVVGGIGFGRSSSVHLPVIAVAVVRHFSTFNRRTPSFDKERQRGQSRRNPRLRRITGKASSSDSASSRASLKSKLEGVTMPLCVEEPGCTCPSSGKNKDRRAMECWVVGADHRQSNFASVDCPLVAHRQFQTRREAMTESGEWPKAGHAPDTRRCWWPR